MRVGSCAAFICCLLIIGVWLRGAVAEKQSNLFVGGIEEGAARSEIEELGFCLGPFCC